MRTRRGFTLIEVLFVIGIIAVLVTILVPVVGNVLARSRVAKCMANMKHVSGAIANQLSNNNGNRIFGQLGFTCLPAELLPNRDLPADINVATSDDLTETGLAVAANTNAMQNVWYMIANYEVTARAFICAADSTTERPAAAARFGWSALTEFSYGIQWPYGTYGIDVATKDRTVIMADRNPGGAVDGSTIKHSNHPNGVVVLFYDGNAKFHEADNSLAGYGRDDIYTDATTATAGAEPTGVGDTSIVPEPSRSP